MAAPRGQVIVRFPIAEVEEASKRALSRAAKEVAAEIEAYAIAKSSRPCDGRPGSHSKPGQYPKMETGEFVSGLRVTGSNTGITFYSQAPHGRYLEEGTINMDPRPWATKAANARNWMAKIAKLARQYTGGSRKPTRRR